MVWCSFDPRDAARRGRGRQSDRRARERDDGARGELVPDDIVVAIVSARIDEPDARYTQGSVGLIQMLRVDTGMGQ